MKTAGCVTSLLICLLLSGRLNAEILVVVNATNPVQQVSKRELVNLYMGRNVHFSDGNLALRLDQQPDARDRELFYQKLVNKNVAQVNAHWARLLFTGRSQPPKTASSAAAVLQTVKNHPYAIGYIDAAHYNQDRAIKVVAQLD